MDKGIPRLAIVIGVITTLAVFVQGQPDLVAIDSRHDAAAALAARIMRDDRQHRVQRFLVQASRLALWPCPRASDILTRSWSGFRSGGRRAARPVNLSLSTFRVAN